MQTLGIPADTITFPRCPGHPPRVVIAGRAEPGLSISHDGLLSVAALNLHGAVGIDLIQVREVPDWENIARDYLGPQTTRRLQKIPAAQRATAFAQAWCLREAMLKYAGLPLVEWSDTTQPSGLSFALEVPATWQGVVVLPDRAAGQTPELAAPAAQPAAGVRPREASIQALAAIGLGTIGKGNDFMVTQGRMGLNQLLKLIGYTGFFRRR